LFTGEPEGIGNRHDAQRLVFGAVEANLGSQDFAVEPMLALGVGLTTVSESSDVECLSTGSEAAEPER